VIDVPVPFLIRILEEAIADNLDAMNAATDRVGFYEGMTQEEVDFHIAECQAENIKIREGIEFLERFL